MQFKGLKKVHEGAFISRYDLNYETVDGKEKAIEFIPYYGTTSFTASGSPSTITIPESEHYTFEWDAKRRISEEYVALGNAQIQGLNSGYFNVIAHPDRIFKRQKCWSEKMAKLSEKTINTARQTNTPLEINESSCILFSY